MIGYYSERRKKVVIARSEATCLHAEGRYGTQACQSDEVVARAKPVAISGDPSLRSGQGLLHGVYPEGVRKRFFASLRMTKNEGFAMTLSVRQVIYDVHYIWNL